MGLYQLNGTEGMDLVEYQSVPKNKEREHFYRLSHERNLTSSWIFVLNMKTLGEESNKKRRRDCRARDQHFMPRNKSALRHYY